MARTFGEHLVDDALPTQYKGRGVFTKGKLHETLVEMAKAHPELYAEAVTKLKRVGDEVATLEGISVGLEDIAPDERRNALLTPFVTAFHKAPAAGREKILLDAQNSMLAYTKTHPSTMGEMIRSGGRGNAPQLMKMVASPVLARDEKDKIVPWIIPRSYSEGLKPSDAWVAGNEARINAIKSNISVVEPGDLAKILVNNMSDKIVTAVDCGTHNGIAMNSTDPHIIDRYLAHAAGGFTPGTLVTPEVARRLSKADSVIVRSPMTCEAAHGICQKCQGLDATGHPHVIGINVGMRAAQAMAEPLTQFSLNAKHGGRIDTGKDHEKRPEGIKGVRQLLEIPQSFLYKATLAEHDGEVSKIEKAPQGGHYVWLGDSRHYVSPDLNVTAHLGQKVTAGDVLSNGVPKPDEIVKYKGLGTGRKYLVDTMYNVYKDAGADMDKRHLEILARSVLNHVYITDPGEGTHGFMKGDIVNFNRLTAALGKDAHSTLLNAAVGETLAKNVLHYTPGTRITQAIRDDLTRRGISSVDVAELPPQIEPIMRAASRTPLLNSDWMQRLAHRYLKESLMSGAHRGDVSDIHGTSPVPGYAHGLEFGQGPSGTY